MTDDKKHEDKDRKKVSDEELEDVAGGADVLPANMPKRFLTANPKTGTGPPDLDNDLVGDLID